MRKYSKETDALKLVLVIPAKFLYFFLQIKGYLKFLAPKYLYCFVLN